MRELPNTAPRELTSIGSPKGVAVPWVSRITRRGWWRNSAASTFTAYRCVPRARRAWDAVDPDGVCSLQVRDPHISGVLAEMEMDLDSLRSDIEAVNRYQALVFERQIEAEQSQPGSFVSDRAFCNLALNVEAEEQRRQRKQLQQHQS